MCVNMKRFYNKWTHTWQYAKCGHCAACMQEKAYNRTVRLKNASYHGYLPIFVTLTYSNDFVPYIKKSELKNNLSAVNVYRASSVRRVRYDENYEMAWKITRKENVLSTVDCTEYRLFPNKKQISELKKLRGQGDNNKVGCIYYKDVQNFEKRLRITLDRFYGVKNPIYSFKCAEYGPTTFRPHFHALFYIPQEILAEFKLAVAQAWPYCDKSEWNDKSFQIAVNVSNYVSSYVNCGSDFPDFLSSRPFRPHHSFSKFLGIQSDSFSPETFFESIRNGNLTYVSKSNSADGTHRFILYPKYVINRYFAKFKGYSRLTNNELRKLCVNPSVLFQPEGEQFLKKLSLLDSDYYHEERLCYDCFGYSYTGSCTVYSPKHISALVNHLNLRLKRFLADYVYYEDGIKYVGLPDNLWTRELFADMMYSCWRTYASRIYSLPLLDCGCISDVLDNYYNLYELDNGVVHSDLYDLFKKSHHLSNPNLFISTIKKTEKMTNIFEHLLKKRKVANHSMSSCGINV